MSNSKAAIIANAERRLQEQLDSPTRWVTDSDSTSHEVPNDVDLKALNALQKSARHDAQVETLDRIRELTTPARRRRPNDRKASEAN